MILGTVQWLYGAAVRCYDLAMVRRMALLRFAAISIAVALPVVAVAGDDRGVNDDQFAGMDAYVTEAMARWQVPGVAVAVVKDGEVVVSRAYGVRHIGRDDPVTMETVFPIASVTKTFTSAAIAKLVGEGKVDWDDPVRRHFPEFRVGDEATSEALTLRDLLCHRTGLVRGDLLFVKGDLDRDEILRRMRHLGQARPLRTSVTYHNVMFLVLGEVIERLSGRSWSTFVSDEIVNPLGLQATWMSHLDVPAERLATRHRTYPDGIAPLRTPLRDLAAPAGAIYSTAGDMAKWLAFQMRLGEFDGRPLIQAATLQESHTIQQSIPVRVDADDDVYDPWVAGAGLGWFVQDYRGYKVVQHGGAWGAELAFVPEENLGVVVLSNLDHNGLVWMLKFDLLDAYLAPPEERWRRGAKWDWWEKIGGPRHTFEARDRRRAELDKARLTDTAPTLPLEAYAGLYEMPLYGLMSVDVTQGQLQVRFGDHRAQLSHWQDDAFYGVAVVEPFLDWLVRFEVRENRVHGLEIESVGWEDADERHIFERRNE